MHDKSTVLQEARVFNQSPISPRACRSLLARIVYLLYCGETFSTQEATQLFFGVTKLFQHKDVRPASCFPCSARAARRNRRRGRSPLSSSSPCSLQRADPLVVPSAAGIAADDVPRH